jgi:hypothetical protein
MKVVVAAAAAAVVEVDHSIRARRQVCPNQACQATQSISLTMYNFLQPPNRQSVSTHL